MNVLEPILERHFHPHSYACRKGKGTHAAADHLQKMMRRCSYALVCDIRKFFPSIDHEILKALFRQRIKDQQLLWLMDQIVDSSNEQEPICELFPGDDVFTPVERRKGLPIGNLTSQWFANWYLSCLDHTVTSHWRVGGYVRYCDDFILLDEDRSKLQSMKKTLAAKLAESQLRLHQRRQSVVPVRHGLRFVGYRIWSTHRLLPKTNVRQFRRRMRWLKKALALGQIDGKEIRCRLTSWLGHARQANTKRLVRRLRGEWFRQRFCIQPLSETKKRQSSVSNSRRLVFVEKRSHEFR